MTVNTTNITSGPYTGNGVAAQFSYTFRVENKNQLSVFETDDTGVEITLTVDTDYTVADTGEDVGGIITRVAGALPTGYTWFIRSNYQTTQQTDFDSQGGFFPDVHESAFDKLTFLLQQIEDVIGRGVRTSSSDSTGSMDALPSSADRIGKLLQFDSGGDPTVVDAASLFAGLPDNVLVVNNLSTLKANTSGTVTRSYVVGHTTEADKGGGWFYFDNSDTSTVDDDIENIIDAQSPRAGTWKKLRKGSLLLNEKGILPGNNMSSAIEDLMAIEGVVEIPAGTYVSDSRVDFQPDRTFIKGQGHATTISIDQSSDHTAFRVAAVGNSDRSHTKFQSMNFTSAGASNGIGIAVDAQAVQPIYCEDLSFFDVGKQSILYYQNYYGKFDECTWWDSGVEFINVNNMKFSGFDFHADPSSTIFSAGDYFVTLRDCDSIVFDTGTFECQIASTLEAYECQDLVFRNTWFEANKDAQVLKFVGCSDVTFDTVYFVAPTASQPSDNFIVVDPTRTHNGLDNVSVLSDSSRAWVDGSQVGATVFNVTDGSSGTITANTLTTLTATLSGGTDNNWDTGDRYSIGEPRDLITQINFLGGRISLGTGTSSAFNFCNVVNGTVDKVHVLINLNGVSHNGGYYYTHESVLSKWTASTLSSPTSGSDLVKFLESLPVADLVDPINTHSGANGAVTLTDREQSWNVNEVNGLTIYNETDGSSGTITGTTATTITATLTGGANNDWSTGDRYTVGGNGNEAVHTQNSWVPQSQMSDPHMTIGPVLTEFTSTTATLTIDRTVSHSNGVSTVCFVPAAETNQVHLRRTASDMSQMTIDGETPLLFIRMRASASITFRITVQGSGAAYETTPDVITKKDEWVDYVFKPSENQVKNGGGKNTTTFFNFFFTNDTGSDLHLWFDRIDYKVVNGDVYLP